MSEFDIDESIREEDKESIPSAVFSTILVFVVCWVIILLPAWAVGKLFGWW